MNKPFTELPRSERTRHLTIVAVWLPNRRNKSMYCEHAGCKQEEVVEVSECPVCGRWMCEECFEGRAMAREVDCSTLATRSCCADCSKLTHDERQAVMELRAKMGGAR